MKIDQNTARQAIYALLDILDGREDHDLEYMTGLPAARCTEIATLHNYLLVDHGPEWLRSIK